MLNYKKKERKNILEKWYSNKKVEIYFSAPPYVGIRYPLPTNTIEENKSIKKYPFINRKELRVCLKDIKRTKCYNFIIPKGYCYDGASIPRAFWRIIGSNTDNTFLIAALVHDVLCENHKFIDCDKNFSTEVFNALLEASSVCAIKRCLMKHSVNFYQNFCKWNSKEFSHGDI